MLLLLIIVVVIIVVVGVASLVNFVFELALSRKEKTFFKKRVDCLEEGKIIKETEAAERDLINEWRQNTFKKQYYIKAYDNQLLYSTVYIQKEFTHKWVIILHGYSGKGEEMLINAKEFHNMGFNVVLPDCRGHGESGGAYITMGWYDRLDIINWSEKIAKGDPKAEIALYGISMGGAAVLMVSGEELPSNIKCIVEDCGYTSVMEQFKYQLKKIFYLPGFPFINIAETICRKKAGYSLSEASALTAVEKNKDTPILFIHGGKDDFVPTAMVYKLYYKATCPKDLLIIPQAGHGISAYVAKQVYWNKINSFIHQYIKNN